MTDIRPMKIALIGCGDIARKSYVPACRKFPFLDLVACADIDTARAAAFAGELSIRSSGSVDQILADPSIELVVNLTIPTAHAAIDLAALRAGKHVFSEKPFATTGAAGAEVVALAAHLGLRVGCAPDTVLGCGVQTSRHYIDTGAVGRVIGGTCSMLCGGPDDWHPNPGFFYRTGGGPLLDMGPYYLHALITLLGPVRRVSGSATRSWEVRTAGCLQQRGTQMPVEVPTHVVSILEFESGAVVSLTVSFDVRAEHGMPNIELWGTEGSIRVPDPNFCDGPVTVSRRGMHGWTEFQRTHPYRDGSRGIGVADMALAIRTGRPHRAGADLAMHALDVMQSVLDSARTGARIEITSTCERPAAMRADLPEWTLDP